VDELVRKLDGGNWKMEDKFKAEILKQVQDDGEQIILVKPQTYMNNSGMAVSLLTAYFKLAPVDLIIVHDELDLPLGKIKVRLGGAAAGHHGVESIIKALGSDKFVRVRLGIGDLKTQSAEHHSQHVNIEKFVLEPFRPDEKSKVKHLLKQAVQALDILINEGLEKAQNQFN
jgi:PTH1 family peptidyl-tRNA hydrolase